MQASHMTVFFVSIFPTPLYAHGKWHERRTAYHTLNKALPKYSLHINSSRIEENMRRRAGHLSIQLSKSRSSSHKDKSLSGHTNITVTENDIIHYDDLLETIDRPEMEVVDIRAELVGREEEVETLKRGIMSLK